MSIEKQLNKFLDSDDEKDEEYEHHKREWRDLLRFCGEFEDPQPVHPQEFATYIYSLPREGKDYLSYKSQFKDLEKSLLKWRKGEKDGNEN